MSVSPGSDWTWVRIPSQMPIHVWIPPNNPRSQYFSINVLYRTVQLPSWQRRGARTKLFYFWNVTLRCFQSEEKLNSVGFNVVSFPPSTAHSELLNPKQACVPPGNQNLGADLIMVWLSKPLEDRKYIQYQVEFLLRKREKKQDLLIARGSGTCTACKKYWGL